MRTRHDHTYDDALRLSDGGLVTADAITLVDGAAAILDLGNSRFEGWLILDAAVIEVASGNESCRYILEFSNSASFASGIVQGPSIVLGDAAATLLANADTDNGAGRYEVGFTNEWPGGTIYRYVRLAQDFAGTIDTGFNVVAYIVKA